MKMMLYVIATVPIPKFMNYVLDDILAMPYYRNYEAVSGAVHNINSHEQAVEDVFIKHNFTIYQPRGEKKPSKREILSWLEDSTLSTTMPPNTFMKQPCGTHNNPDFIVKSDNGSVFGFECKSSKTTTYPMYNSGGIKTNIIYIFCSEKTNKTTIYLGQDIQTVRQQNLISDLELKIKKLVEEYNIELKKEDIHQRGVYFYPRSMICQRDPGLNYFTHEQREQCEKNVYSFVANTKIEPPPLDEN